MKIKFLLPLLLIQLIASAQHSIRGTFDPTLEYKWAILYKVTATGTKYTVDSKIKEDGGLSLYLKPGSETGIYRLVYAVPQELNSFDIIYDGQEDITFVFNTDQKVQFTYSKENKLLAAYQSEMQAIQTKIARLYSEGYTAVAPLFKELNEKQTQYENDSKGAIVHNIIQANRTYIPAKAESFDDYIKNTKKEYFTNVDFNNSILRESSFLTDYSYNYIAGFIDKNESEESTFTNIDVVYSLLQNSDSAYQQAFFHRLWENFIAVEKYSVANYIAEKYLIPISELNKDYQLVRELTVFKNLSIGVKPPNFSWENEELGKPKSQSLYDLKGSKNYIIIFWSSGCSHCLLEIPELYKFMDKIDIFEYQVIAIGLEDEPSAWKNKIADFPKFTNVLGLGKWENQIGNDYDVNSTPTYFILDKDKKIIAKPEDLETLVKIISENLTK